MPGITALLATLLLQAPAWHPLGSSEPIPGAVQGFVVAPDGSRVATVGEDARLILWDVARGAEIARFDGAAPYGTVLGFSGDSKLLAAHVPLWTPTTFHVWNAVDGEELTGWSTVELGPGDLREDGELGRWREGARLHLHPSGATLFHPSDYKSVVVSSARVLVAPEPATHRRWAVIDGGRTVAVARTSGCVGGRVPEGQREDELDVRLFEVDGGAELAHVRWAELQPESWPFPGDHLAITREELAFPVRGEVRVLDFDGKERARFGSGVRALVQDGDRRITGHQDGSVSFWKGTQRAANVLGIGRPVRGLKCAEGRVLIEGDGKYALAHEKGRLLGPRNAREGRVHGPITLLRDGDERLHVFKDAQELREFRLSTWIYDEYDTRNVPCAARGDTVWYLDAGRVQAAGVLESGELFTGAAHSAAIARVRFGPEGAIVATHRAARRIGAAGEPMGHVIDTASARWFAGEVVRLDADEGHRSQHAFARDGSSYAVRAGGHVRVVDAAGRRTEHEFGLEGTPIALSPDGKLLAGAWREARASELVLRVIALPSGDAAWSVRLPGPSCDFLDFAPAGRSLALNSGRAVHVFDRHGKQVLETQSGPAGMNEDVESRSFDWSPDGRHFVTVSHARPVVVRDAASGAELLRFDAPAECYGHFARLWMAPDGERFAVGYSERDVVYVWSATKGREAELRLATGNAHEPVAWLSKDEIVVAGTTGATVITLSSGARETLPTPRAPNAVFADAAGRRIAVVERARVFLYARR